MRQYRYMRGQKLKLATIDEMAEVDDLEAAVDDVLFPAVWDSHGEMALFGTPPVVPTPDNPVMRYVATAKLNGSYFHATVYDAGYSTEEIAEAIRETSKGELDYDQALTLVEAFDPAAVLTIEQIKDISEGRGISAEWLTRFRREFMAEFIRDESAVIVPEFIEKLHVVPTVKPVYYDLLYKGTGADLGVADKTVEVFGHYDFPRATAVIESEFFLEGADVRTDVFAAKHLACVVALGWKPKTDRRITAWSDNSNLMLLNDLNALHGIVVNATDKEDKTQWLNLVKIMFKQNRIQVDPSCKLSIATLNGAFWKDARRLDYGRTKALGHMDALDAVIYFIRNLNMTSNPLPVNYNISSGNVYDRATTIYPANWDKVPHTEEGRVIARIFGRGRIKPRTNGSSVIGGL
jgi:hypothetical protein